MDWIAPRRSHWFKAWAETADGRSYLEREARCRAIEDARRAEVDRIGPEAYFQLKLQGMIGRFRHSVEVETRLKLTAELLESSFALGDGVMVSWGDATVEQHRKRMDLLFRNAEGNVRTASRHEIAVQMIEASGVSSLRQVAKRGADSTAVA